MKQYLSLLTALIITLLTANATFAQDAAAADTSPISYYLAADENGVQQVWQLLLDSESEPRQITTAESDVLTFGAAYDGLSVAYISDGQLWLQPIHTATAEALTSVSAERFLSSPVYSPDDQYIAYADNGVWLLDLSTRETRQLLADVPLKEMASNADEFRIYAPELFVLDADGQASKLIVDVGVWEWNSVGVYDLVSGELQELEGQLHTSLLPLSDGRVLLYGNGGVAGEAGLHLADSLDSINDYQELLNFRSLTESIMFAEQAVEIEPGVVRIYGQTTGIDPNDAAAFSFDFNVETGVATEVRTLTLAAGSENVYTISGRLSPEGELVPVYLNTVYDDFGAFTGSVKLFDLATGEALAIEFPESSGMFRWQEQP